MGERRSEGLLVAEPGFTPGDARAAYFLVEARPERARVVCLRRSPSEEHAFKRRSEGYLFAEPGFTPGDARVGAFLDEARTERARVVCLRGWPSEEH